MSKQNGASTPPPNKEVDTMPYKRVPTTRPAVITPFVAEEKGPNPLDHPLDQGSPKFEVIGVAAGLATH
jgi:hypothetical protein